MKARQGCVLCQIIAEKVPAYKVYEDDIAMAVLDVNGANPGHTFVMPKNHYPILEQVPDEEVGHLFTVANKISSSIFENLNAQGTNLFVANGIPAGQKVAHFMINVIPRHENDSVNLQWQPKQLEEEEMSTVELKLKEQVEEAGVKKPETSKKEAQPEQQKAPPVHSDDDEEDYFHKQMRRVP